MANVLERDVDGVRVLTLNRPEALNDVVYGTFQRPIRAIRTMTKPVIAAVNGAAVGAGCELAVASDFRIASTHARFGEVWIGIGCIPALGGMYLLPRIVGLTRAMEMILTGEIIDAGEARRIGLVSRVAPPEALLDEALALAARLARGPARALAAAKAAINRGLGTALDDELTATVTAQMACFRTRDFAEGVRALAERRAPRFTGRLRALSASDGRERR
ncbi:MAG: enoyl-CoA hydratase/isomerase family protein [Candidatus Rokubacteria bacterium]|nr:enoyl-CoA hydratase/isomerase family protein [Candidatus Rokubacteria bacterium]